MRSIAWRRRRVVVLSCSLGVSRSRPGKTSEIFPSRPSRKSRTRQLSFIPLRLAGRPEHPSALRGQLFAGTGYATPDSARNAAVIKKEPGNAAGRSKALEILQQFPAGKGD